MAPSRAQTQKRRLQLKLAARRGGKKICLTMIVRNESANMPRLLDSIKSIIDFISIVDTGSTDNTKEVIMAWSQANGIPATVHHLPFRDFAFNRTHSARVAQETYPEADYLLLSDADFIWKISDFNKSLLIDHKYLIQQFNKAMDYWNIRLLSTEVDWECIGVTHEYWTECKKNRYQGEVRTAKIHTLQIDDREDGGCKSDKFTRDEKLLRDGLANEKSKDLQTRYKFYLAQTLKDTEQYQESIIWYERRFQDKGWVEEVYYSKFQVGFCHEQLMWRYRHVLVLLDKEERSEADTAFIAKWNKESWSPMELAEKQQEHLTAAEESYLAAHQYRKCRAEALYYCTRMFRLLGDNEKSYKLAVQGNQIKYPEQDTLFIERSCYTYLFDFEISITAFYLPAEKDKGRQAVSRLLDRDDLPSEIREVTEKNSRLYI